MMKAHRSGSKCRVRFSKVSFNPYYYSCLDMFINNCVMLAMITDKKLSFDISLHDMDDG